MGGVFRQIIMGCCRPIYWFGVAPETEILSNGTITFLQTPAQLIGITAAHVLEGYVAAKAKQQVRVQIANAVVDDLEARRVATNANLDLATVDLTGIPLTNFGNDLWPLQSWPPMPPEEGCGIMLGGYPGQGRQPVRRLENVWGLFTALGIARTVSEDQITWIVPRDEDVHVGAIEKLPPHYDLGGISGGPLISSFESKAGFVTHRLAGIISEAQPALEYVVAKRVDGLKPDGALP